MAGEIEDQKQTEASGGAQFGTSGDQKRAQTFKPAVPWAIGITLRPEPSNGNPADSVVVELQSVGVDGKPSGNVLASKTVSASDWAAHAFQAYNVLFDSPYNGMTLGATYAIVLRRSGALDDSNFYNASYKNEDPYANGGMQTYNGSTWTENVGNDFYFKTLFSGYPQPGDTAKCLYRFDMQPYVAQELTLEPKQTVEGIDGLGSDTVQLWAPMLKEVSGSIKEVFKPGSQNQLSQLEMFAGSPEVFWGIIVEFDDGGNAVKIGLDKVVFPEGSLPSPKGSPVFIVTPFRAMTIKTIA